MTDAPYPLQPVNGSDLNHAAIPSAFAANHHQHYTPPVVDHVQEDDGQINCVCGSHEDDGMTVACDECNSWQHIACYYPPNTVLPEDAQHFCVECRPRNVDPTQAHHFQQLKREQSEHLTNGVKRTASKSHKKKIKEPNAPYTNGWPVDNSRHDRTSASPRDHPPPAKRPKTSHRQSDSTTTASAKTHSRKRNLSSVHHRRSPSQTPDARDKYSGEFLQCHRDDDWTVTDANLYNSIAITGALTDWLNAPDPEFREEHGHEKHEVLMRWDGKLDDIPGRAQIEILEDQDRTVQYEGQHPSWKMVTVQEAIAGGAYIGELKGQVGFKDEYLADPANRWPHLSHPEPFVFFHPKLPVYIDARHEGTELRYVRRSCNPNARLQILVTDGVDYHFCFMATQQIEPGAEVSVSWDTMDVLPGKGREPLGRLSPPDLNKVADWVSKALANCGPCACSEQDCRMARLDRRKEEAQSSKLPKAKRRKPAQHVSPIDTNTLNSRSGSEVRKVEPDDEATDSRSGSGSAGRGSASRDITPSTHYSANGLSAATEMSERERKKVAREEEIFRRQETQGSKHAKKKRNSAGSNVNTPSATSSKQLGFPPMAPSRYADAGTSKQSGLPGKSNAGRKLKVNKTPARPVSRIVHRTKPTYLDAETQCDWDREQAVRPSPTQSAAKRPYLSTSQRLLKLCARNNTIIQASKQKISPSGSGDVPMTDSAATSPVIPNGESRRSPARTSSGGLSPKADPTPSDDIEMEDVTPIEQTASSPPPLPMPVKSPIPDYTRPIHHSPSPGSPARPWSSKPSSHESSPHPPTTAHKRANMHLNMPPPGSNPFATPALPPSAGTPTVLSQSPASMTGAAPMFSPSASAAVAPSPAKKMSLSDYTRRRRDNKENDVNKVERESSPASVASAGPVVPPLLPTSSTEVRAAEGSAIVEDDVRIDDALPDAAAAAAAAGSQA